MPFKPVGADENGLFPTRVMNALRNVFAQKSTDLGNQKLVRVTKAQYAALSRDMNTLYMISDWSTFIDTFTRADSTAGLGTTESGNLTWLSLNGSTWGVIANQAYNASNTASGLAVVETGSANHTAQVSMVALDAATSLVVRCTDAINWLAVMYQSGTGVFGVYRNVAGTITQLTVSGTTTAAAGDTLRCVMSGSTGTIYRNSAPVATFSDSSTGTKSGLRANSNVGRFDNFSITT